MTFKTHAWGSSLPSLSLSWLYIYEVSPEVHWKTPIDFTYQSWKDMLPQKDSHSFVTNLSWFFIIIYFYMALRCIQPGQYPGKWPCAAMLIYYQLDCSQLFSQLQQASWKKKTWKTAIELLPCKAENQREGCHVFFTDFCREVLKYWEHKRKSGKYCGIFWETYGWTWATTVTVTTLLPLEDGAQPGSLFPYSTDSEHQFLTQGSSWLAPQ